MIIAVNFPIQAIGRKKPENIKASTGFEPVASAIRPLRDTMGGFTAQLVEHRTGVGEVTGSDPLEALIFSGFFLPLA